MALNLTPSQFTRRADFYRQLAQLTGAGLGLIRALKQLEQAPPAWSYVKPIQVMLRELGDGCTLSEALRQTGNWMPEFDIALLHAGEQSGRLDSCFRLLSDYYNDRARMMRQLIGDLMYPAFLFHMAVFILPFARFFTTGNWFAYLLETFGVLIPIYAIILLAIYAAQSRHGERWRGWLELVLHPIPLLGTGRRYLALSRLAGALEALLSAGVTIIQSWELAAAACGSPALRRTILGWRHLVDAGQTPAEAITTSGAFPEMFASQYATGEISGQLDDALKRLRDYYQEEGSRKIRAVAQWTPRGIYLLVALLIAFRVVSFWMGYFQQIKMPAASNIGAGWLRPLSVTKLGYSSAA